MNRKDFILGLGKLGLVVAAGFSSCRKAQIINTAKQSPENVLQDENKQTNQDTAKAESTQSNIPTTIDEIIEEVEQIIAPVPDVATFFQKRFAQEYQNTKLLQKYTDILASTQKCIANRTFGVPEGRALEVYGTPVEMWTKLPMSRWNEIPYELKQRYTLAQSLAEIVVDIMSNPTDNHDEFKKKVEEYEKTVEGISTVIKTVQQATRKSATFYESVIAWSKQKAKRTSKELRRVTDTELYEIPIIANNAAAALESLSAEIRDKVILWLGRALYECKWTYIPSIPEYNAGSAMYYRNKNGRICFLAGMRALKNVGVNPYPELKWDIPLNQ